MIISYFFHMILAWIWMCSSPNHRNSLCLSVLSWVRPVTDKDRGMWSWILLRPVKLKGFVKSLTVSGWQKQRKKTIAVGQYALNTFCSSSIFSFGWVYELCFYYASSFFFLDSVFCSGNSNHFDANSTENK